MGAEAPEATEDQDVIRPARSVGGANTGAAATPVSPAADYPAVVALVDRVVVTGDRAAFGDLYDRYVERIFRYLYYRTGSHAEAEDLTEQVFVEVWQSIGGFRWRGRPFAAWLYRLAHNVLVDHLRGRPGARAVSLDDESRPLHLVSEAAATELARQLDAEVLSQALRQLTTDQQQVVMLRFIDGLPGAEVARLMGKREGAIRILQLRALRSLRRLLDEQGGRSAL